ncbi:hypothetical protein CL628_00160 [bacterium]|nr:hypothetical protein [bacterium]
MTDEQLQKLGDLISQSSLTSEEQADFVSAIKALDDVWLQPVVKLARAYPEVLPSLYKNLKAKQAAVESGDSAAWEQVMADEAQWLKRFEAATAQE